MCATIRKFDTLDLLNNNKPMDGLVLIIAFTPNGLEITINLPKTLQVRGVPRGISVVIILSDDAYIGSSAS